MAVRIFLTGVSGFVGASLLPRLLQEGHEISALARDRDRVRQALSFSGRATLADFQLTVGDVLTATHLNRAMRGCEAAYYLIHSMEPTETDGSTTDRASTHPPESPSPAAPSRFPVRERIAAEVFADAAHLAGVRRIVYLGGPLPRDRLPSPHLSSRHAVERILLEAVPDSIALRASIVIGARSRSFRFLVRLVERMPVLTLPAWRHFSSRPIDERDVVAMLAACASATTVSGRSLDIGGPEILTYGEIVRRIAELMLLGRPIVGLNMSVTPFAARLAAVMAGESPEFVLPLMESLTGDLLPTDRGAAALLDVELHSFDSAVEHALYEWEKVEPLAAR